MPWMEAVSIVHLPSAPFVPKKIWPSISAKLLDQSPKMYLPAQGACGPRYTYPPVMEIPWHPCGIAVQFLYTRMGSVSPALSQEAGCVFGLTKSKHLSASILRQP